MSWRYLAPLQADLGTVSPVAAPYPTATEATRRSILEAVPCVRSEEPLVEWAGRTGTPSTDIFVPIADRRSASGLYPLLVGDDGVDWYQEVGEPYCYDLAQNEPFGSIFPTLAGPWRDGGRDSGLDQQVGSFGPIDEEFAYLNRARVVGSAEQPVWRGNDDWSCAFRFLSRDSGGGTLAAIMQAVDYDADAGTVEVLPGASPQFASANFSLFLTRTVSPARFVRNLTILTPDTEYYAVCGYHRISAAQVRMSFHIFDLDGALVGSVAANRGATAAEIPPGDGTASISNFMWLAVWLDVDIAADVDDATDYVREHMLGNVLFGSPTRYIPGIRTGIVDPTDLGRLIFRNPSGPALRVPRRPFPR